MKIRDEWIFHPARSRHWLPVSGIFETSSGAGGVSTAGRTGPQRNPETQARSATCMAERPCGVGGRWKLFHCRPLFCLNKGGKGTWDEAKCYSCCCPLAGSQPSAGESGEGRAGPVHTHMLVQGRSGVGSHFQPPPQLLSIVTGR